MADLSRFPIILSIKLITFVHAVIPFLSAVPGYACACSVDLRYFHLKFAELRTFFTCISGHVVFGTLHTQSAPKTIDRIIDVFPSDEQEKIRMTLSEALKGVIAQALFKQVGGGRVAALEILVCNTAISTENVFSKG